MQRYRREVLTHHSVVNTIYLPLRVKLVERLDKASTAYGMEISAEKTKLMTQNTNGINTESKVNGQKLETVTSLKYLGLSYD